MTDEATHHAYDGETPVYEDEDDCDSCKI
jgi:hypothetical protein